MININPELVNTSPMSLYRLPTDFSFKIREVNQSDVTKAITKLNSTFSAYVSDETCDVAEELTLKFRKSFGLRPASVRNDKVSICKRYFVQ